MAESTQPLFAFPSRWPQLADFMSFESAAQKQKFIELMSTRDTDLEDAWPDGSGNAATGAVVMQKHFSGNSGGSINPGPAQASFTWALDLTTLVDADPASTYRAVFDYTTSANIDTAGDYVTLKSVWWETQINETTIGAVTPTCAIAANNLQGGPVGDNPMWHIGNKVSAIIPYDYNHTGNVYMYNLGGTYGGTFWPVNISVDLLITVYQLDPAMA